MSYIDVLKNGKKILGGVKLCSTFQENVRGYMFRKKAQFNGMLLTSGKKQKMPIHMFFVWFPLNVYWIDDRFVVQHKKERARPFMPQLSSKKPVKFVLESIKDLKLNVGDRLMFRYKH